MRNLIVVASLIAAGCSSDALQSPTAPTVIPAVEVQSQVTTHAGPADKDAPYLVIENVRFLGSENEVGCAIAADVSNRGAATQPFGWTWTVEIPRPHIAETFVGQQPLLPGETRVLVHNPGVIEAGTYRVKVSALSNEGRTKAAGATLRIPCR